MPPKSSHAKAPRPCDRAAAERQQSDRWDDCHPKRRPAPMLSRLAMGGGGYDAWRSRRDAGDGNTGKGGRNCSHGILPVGLRKAAKTDVTVTSVSRLTLVHQAYVASFTRVIMNSHQSTDWVTVVVPPSSLFTQMKAARVAVVATAVASAKPRHNVPPRLLETRTLRFNCN